MPQSIRHLIALPELRSRLLSGAGGLDRRFAGRMSANSTTPPNGSARVTC